MARTSSHIESESVTLSYDQVRMKIEQMADAMMRQDNEAVISHFADDAVMIAPAGRFVGKQSIYDAGAAFNANYTNIRIVVKRVILDCDGRIGALEWSFAETRKSDGYTHVMEDAIVFELRGDKVVYWREYFDPLQEREL
ncbi:MAG: nuclear transport factor 2 family protein [Anaerolineae bacterium]|nr:nuclear transport factor 2 family protein [Candidatus Roseilinea sp.]MDW8451165.1 nuclear transport factor 2 family protein [Anaerolineae bacterium]